MAPQVHEIGLNRFMAKEVNSQGTELHPPLVSLPSMASLMAPSQILSLASMPTVLRVAPPWDGSTQLFDNCQKSPNPECTVSSDEDSDYEPSLNSTITTKAKQNASSEPICGKRSRDGDLSFVMWACEEAVKLSKLQRHSVPDLELGGGVQCELAACSIFAR